MSTAVQAPAREVLLSLIAPEKIQHHLHNLEDAPEDIYDAHQRVNECELALAAFNQGEMAKAQQGLEAAMLTASLCAPQDGKNAEQRKMQLDHYLLTDPGMVKARADLRAAEKQRLTLEYDVSMAKAALDRERDLFRATLCAVEMLTALVNQQ